MSDRTRLSVLDLAILSDGATSSDALLETTSLAQCADDQGFSRFWVAEHHNMATVASTTPPVLIAHLAASTSRLRLGSGGVMLPNHPPLVVAEQFAMLEALHPGRIDVGIGRAPGTDGQTAMALRRSADALGAEDFPRQLLDLMGLLGDIRTEHGLWDRFRATPVAVTSPMIFLLGSSGYSAELAGHLGLPFSFAHHFDLGSRDDTLRAFALYRNRFRPSPVLDAPFAIVSANVLVAPTVEEAEFEAGPGRLLALARRSGRFEPIVSPEVAAADPGLAMARSLRTGRLVGTPGSVADEIERLADDCEAAEVMVATVTHGIAARCQSLMLLAEEWQRREILGDSPSANLPRR